MEVQESELFNMVHIGDGGFANVYSATFQNEQVAVKKFKVVNEGTQRMFRREIKLIQNLDHPNIIKLKGYCIGPGTLIMVLELASSNLEDLWPQLTESLDELQEQIKNLCLDISKALEFIHGCKVIHHDLKPANILVTGDKVGSFRAKISDFGISKTMMNTTTQTHGGGTLHYSAPELFGEGDETEEEGEEERVEPGQEKEDSTQNKKSGQEQKLWSGLKTPLYGADIFSFGMVLYFLCSKSHAWKGKSPKQIMRLILDDKRPPVPEKWWSWSKTLMVKCWSHDPLKRPTASQLVQEVLSQIYIQKKFNAHWKCNNHGVGVHTSFVSYRVKYDSDLAEKLALRVENGLLRRLLERNEIKLHLVPSIFFDSDCLNEGEPWNEGFISAIRKSKSEILLISRQSFDDVIQKASTNKDNVLSEWEESMDKKDSKKLILYVDDGVNEFKPFGTALPDEPHLATGRNIKQTIDKIFELQSTRVVRGKAYKEVVPKIVKWIEENIKGSGSEPGSESGQVLNFLEPSRRNENKELENMTDKEIEEEIKKKEKELEALRKEFERRKRKELSESTSSGRLRRTFRTVQAVPRSNPADSPNTTNSQASPFEVHINTQASSSSQADPPVSPVNHDYQNPFEVPINTQGSSTVQEVPRSNNVYYATSTNSQVSPSNSGQPFDVQINTQASIPAQTVPPFNNVYYPNTTTSQATNGCQDQQHHQQQRSFVAHGLQIRPQFGGGDEVQNQSTHQRQ